MFVKKSHFKVNNKKNILDALIIQQLFNTTILFILRIYDFLNIRKINNG